MLHGPRGFQKPVALKLLRAGLVDPERAESLVHEARLGAQLQHPNVVGTLELGCEEPEAGGAPTWYVAMELVRGTSVAALFRSAPPAPGAALEVGVQTCAALAHIHKAGLVHRDVKPQNLLVDENGLVRLADLGSAVLAGATPWAEGTPGFMAPEVLQGRVDARSDLFAVGAMLYMLLARARPFAGVPTADELEARLADPAFLAPLDAAAPVLGELLLRCLRPDPAARWPSALALGDALARLRGAVASQPSLGALMGGGEQPAPAVPGLGSDSATIVHRGNLPHTRDAWFGRADELTEVLTGLRAPGGPLVLCGPGGIGKTRLALEAAARLERDLQGGAWFFDLAECRTGAALVAAVGHALGVELRGGDEVGRVGHALRSKGRALLVFDNLEQCISHLPDTVGRWSGQAPDASVLCTSRLLTRLPGERVVRLGPLSEDEGLALLRNRATVSLPDAQEAQARQVVRTLQCIPLSIELAAARLVAVPLGAMATLLAERLSVLAGGGGDLPERHRSVAASLEWSWTLLPGWVRSALAALSVCEGGFDLQAAGAIVQPPPGVWALDALHELVDASLLHMDPETGRFSMLVVVQQFALEKLDAASRAEAEGRHGRYYAQLNPRTVGPTERPSISELDNLIAACRRAVARQDPEVAAATFLGAWEVVELIGPMETALELAEAVLELTWSPGCRDLEARVARVAGDAAHAAGRMETASVHFTRSIAAARAADDRAAEARALGALAAHQFGTGPLQDALDTGAESLQLLQACGDRHGEVVLRMNLGHMEVRRGAPAAARAHYEHALRLARALGHRRSEGRLLSDLASLHRHQGRMAESEAHYFEALSLLRQLGDHRWEGTVLGNLGNLYRQQGRIDEARESYAASLARYTGVGSPRVEALIRANLGILQRVQGHVAEATLQQRRALELLADGGHPRAEALVLSELAALEPRADRARTLLERAEDLLDERETPVVLGHVALRRAELEHRTGAWKAARAAWDRARDLAIRASVGADSELGHELAVTAALLDLPGTAADPLWPTTSG